MSSLPLSFTHTPTHPHTHSHTKTHTAQPHSPVSQSQCCSMCHTCHQAFPLKILLWWFQSYDCFLLWCIIFNPNYHKLPSKLFPMVYPLNTWVFLKSWSLGSTNSLTQLFQDFPRAKWNKCNVKTINDTRLERFAAIISFSVQCF